MIWIASCRIKAQISVSIFLAILVFLFGPIASFADDFAMTDQGHIVDQKLLQWIKTNVSPQTGLPYSFYIPEVEKHLVYQNMGEEDTLEGIIERVIVEEGFDIYDAAVAQILLTRIGGQDNLEWAQRPLEAYFQGSLGKLHKIRAGFSSDDNFIYDPENPDFVKSDLSEIGERGFLFRIINANGKYLTKDPLDGKETLSNFPNWPAIHWEDWKPVAGENAWVTMAALHLYHKKYFDSYFNEYNHDFDSVEFRLAEEIARAAMALQADVGGVRMAPIGTYHKSQEKDKELTGLWWYYQISSENNLSWYAAFRMLYQVTGNDEYRLAMGKIETFLKIFWNADENYFYQGANFKDGAWHPNNEDFALDVQTWSLCALGPKKIDEILGEGTAFKVWQTAKTKSGVFDNQGKLLGVGFIEEHDRLSVEWTSGAVMAARLVSDHYHESHPEWAKEAKTDAMTMREGIETLRSDIDETKAAYSYSSRRGWIPFGWFSHESEVLSLASTGWVALIDGNINPFYLPQMSNQVSLSFK